MEPHRKGEGKRKRERVKVSDERERERERETRNGFPAAVYMASVCCRRRAVSHTHTHTHGPAAHLSATKGAPLALEATLFPVALSLAVVPLRRLFAVYFTDTTESHPVEKVATILKDCDARWT